MEVYSAKVRLAGNVLNEVPQNEITPADIACLRAIHGADAVVNIEHAGSIKRTAAEERERIEMKYGQGLRSAGHSMIELFGQEYQPMPVKLAGFDPDDEADDEPEDPKAVRRRTKPKGSALEAFENEEQADLMA